MTLFQRLTGLTLAFVLLAGFAPAAVNGQARATAGARSSQPADYKSKNFLVHTDLPAEEAKALLEKLETMLVLISKYWARPNKQVIEMYVIKDINNWPQGSLDPRGAQSVLAGGGVTMSSLLTQGNNFLAKATVYAGAERGTPQHEAVHAYCSQSFGTTGPVWYSEGMAEMGCYWREGDASVNCEEGIVRYIRGSDPKSLNEIVNGNELTGDSWQNYAWRWALCHLLANNKNYAERFRPLGLGILTKQDVSFEQTYGAMANEISFEYLFFLQHLERGYRVDLCSWDWKTKYTTPRGSAYVLARIEANQGWQPSRLLVKQGETYEVSAEGTWKITKDGEGVNGNGAATGKGKLVGIVFNDYKLSAPFEVGAYGTFTAPSDGNLLLRCQDEWHEIADNSGRMTVKLKGHDPGARLPKPKDVE